MPSLARLPILALALGAMAPSSPDPEMTRWRAEAANVTIVRDDWGIPHITGKTDADAVFGMIYAQAEDDFSRIEANYLTALGRTAEAPGAGEDAVWADLRQRLFVDPAELQRQYAASPAWLKKLMDAWADGLNFYLATHPEVKPKVLTRFEPWMALSFTEGSIGGDIERISLSELKTFYGKPTPKTAMEMGPREPTGSNGIAIAPKLTKDGHALLLINPHTSFYFRSEAQVTSGEGLNAYGASTWGQFFVYQGFNAKAGWMHTSSTVDNVDEFAETVSSKSGMLALYRYGKGERAFDIRPVTITYRKPDGSMGSRTFSTWRSHHGPITAARDGKWIATALMWKPVPALEQSFLRTKATDIKSYLAVAERKSNSSNDTLFADSKGEIAFLMPQFMPVRDGRFDYTKPVDGSDPATDWKGLHSLVSLPSVLDPMVGWVRNTNDWPWQAAGADSPKAASYPKYMDQVGPNFRGTHADALLAGSTGWTLEGLRTAAYDPHLPAFALLIPRLSAAFDALPVGDPARVRLAAPVAALRSWDCRWSADSKETALAAFWGDALLRMPAANYEEAGLPVWQHLQRATPRELIAALDMAVARLTREFGDWRVPWGEINRFQRLDDAIDAPRFDDAGPSVAVPFTSAIWGSLASFGAKPYPGTRRWYGSGGDSFVAVVEFGPRVRAMAVMVGGQSGDVRSKHFTDQIERYASGKLRPVYFYPDQLAGHVERRYRPGE
ncbi:MAG: penicillin acylase family protein [Sphingomonas sp.]|uniref:penicillin acylase family protein n=1 Tax=Sphingomonas sp. TaxID=28214 RepID=UPI001AC94006|nr:penicillin acylase family protein [Sphingomonas sp.]MBN8816930.1 penicillin acylase family protein [Sphingomonas sp.]